MAKPFAFDAVYDTDSLQQTVYDESGFPLVESVIEGYNGTIFAYGQTGCGKTHTMLGIPDNPDLRGIIPNCFAHIYSYIDGNKDGMKFLVRCSYLEIYNEEIHDLLDQSHGGTGPGNNGPRKLELKEDPQKGVFVKDLSCIIVKSIPEIEKAMIYGTNNRKVAETNMNKDSSRSHSIFTIYIETAQQVNGEQRIKAGKLNLVDLAGSERSSKTGATGQTLKEGIKINLSLTALGNVISALVDGKSAHIPYRDSKLTRLLQDSLGGNTKTVMIAAVSPADYNYEETLSTLRYASRAKAIKNKPVVNEDPKDALLKEYEEEIKKLKEMLQNMSSGKEVNIAKQLTSFKKKISSDHIQMDIQDLGASLGDKNKGKKKGNKQSDKEETVEDLIAKLESKGKKVAVIDPTQQQQQSNTDIKVDGQQMNQELEGELKSKEQALEAERQEKEQLAKLIQELEKKLVVGGQAVEDKEREQLQKHREMQLQLRKQKKKEKQLLEQKRKKEEEVLLVEKNYKSLQEEVDDMRDIIKKLRDKYKAAQMEIEDLQHEQQYNKEDLLEDIRSQEKDLKFANRVMKIMLSENELYKIREKAQWDENKQDWKVPLFIFNNKENNIMFPNINAQSRVNQSKDERNIQFDSDEGDNQVRGNQKMKQAGKPNGDKVITPGQEIFEVSGYNGAQNSSIEDRGESSNDDYDKIPQSFKTDNQKFQTVQIKGNNTKNAFNGGSQSQNSTKYNPGQVPERRNKYLRNNGTDEPDIEEEQLQRKKNNVHLQPLQNNTQNRNSSMQPRNLQILEQQEQSHPITHMPSPQQRGGGKLRLDKLDHNTHKLTATLLSPEEANANYIANLPQPSPGGKKKLDPIFKQ